MRNYEKFRIFYYVTILAILLFIAMVFCVADILLIITGNELFVLIDFLAYAAVPALHYTLVLGRKAYVAQEILRATLQRF